jgi:hypothetical protein
VAMYHCEYCILSEDDPELDLGTKLGPERPKNENAQNFFKTGVLVGLIDTNTMQIEWDQMEIVFSRYGVLFIWPNKKKK